MKKVKSIFLLCMIALVSSGCNKYICVKSDNELFYGLFNRRDMIHADVKLYKKDSAVTCDGMIYLNSPSRMITLKNDDVDANAIIGCSDKKLIKANFTMSKGGFDRLNGEGLDQFNNKYLFETISKDDFVQNVSGKKYELINDKRESILKY